MVFQVPFNSPAPGISMNGSGVVRVGNNYRKLNPLIEMARKVILT